MSKLSSPGHVSRLLEQHGVKLKKKWGQNFLVDENILKKIISAADVQKSDRILEIGPGIGSLTQKLAENASRVLTVEIDTRLIPVLRETLAEYDNVEIIHGDAMDFDPAPVCEEGPVKLVANLPYNVATPLLYRWLKDSRNCFSRLVCMVQKEVAERIVAKPGSKAYGTLSVICNYAARCEIAFDVPRTVFFPRPDVSSAVVQLIPYHVPAEDVADDAFFFKVVEAVFAQRRKTLLNTLNAAFPLTKEQLTAVCSAVEIDLSRRGETLTLQEFAKLSRVLYNKVGGL
ncbi:16S rRNA (adenine(1518)-N(6)/adenine(1519)-N(6))-dimethyltransferase RsmA [Dethiobacter alkaliphilus]|uniref:16S rRNA (adenine(1518)-N(6)/adenine(1519)-N(6))- dimethyltransferase RsmA n=1 Tax=Dethiobacter alkaliphilus TaxID=427926 RepID=UPI000682ED50|nr:16S rRNA (adenine(1518)-N(6)/adenine(1519)-N(6))-dimethyltransferase RsmA [Dethiobacter alkaliphilus]